MPDLHYSRGSAALLLHESYVLAVAFNTVVTGTVLAISTPCVEDTDRPLRHWESQTEFGAYVVAAWLWGIIVNLLRLIPGYYDVALRDFGLSLGALAPGRLAEQFEKR